MHVEISVALNFVVSYLYNKLPRRRVDLFSEELENALKKKFEGHWYPEKPNKGSGFRCIKANGEEIDNVLTEAANKAGLDIGEVRNYLPDDLTLWIDPSEVSYKLGERGPVKVLYTDRKDEDGNENMDNEVQAASKTFNPEALTFTPEAAFSQDMVPFCPDDTSYCPDIAQTYQSFQSFQPIDSMSSSLSNLSLSPSSPLPPGTWSTRTSPSSTLFTSAPQSSPVAAAPPSFVQKPINSSKQQMTAAMFAQTKFGSTKLKTNAKRPNRLSPTEFGNFFKQQQTTYAGPQRPRSLSPRDPRVEFLMDKHQRFYMQHQQQLSPSMPYSPHFNQQQMHQQQQQHHQQLSPNGWYPEFNRYHSSSISSTHSSPHISPQLSPHMSPQSNGPAFQDLIQNNPNFNSLPSPSANAIRRPNSLAAISRPNGLPGINSLQTPSPHHSLSSPLSPETQNCFTDGLGMGNSGYSNSLQHLLMAN